MNNILKTSLKLKNTYDTNKFLDSFNLNNSKIIKNEKTKKNLRVLFFIFRILISLISKILFVLVFIVAFTIIYKYLNLSQLPKEEILIYIFIFWNIGKPLLSSNLFEITNNNYYAIFFLKLDSKKYLLTNYYIKIIYSAIIEFISLMILKYFFDISLGLIFILLVFEVFSNIFCEAVYIYEYQKNNLKYKKAKIILGGFLVLLGYALPLLNFSFMYNIFKSVYFGIFVLGILSLIYLENFNNYYDLMKRDFNYNNILEDTYIIQNKKNAKTSYSKTKKQGCEYLNNVFFSRNKLKYIILFFLFIILSIGLVSIFITNFKTADKEGFDIIYYFELSTIFCFSSFFDVYFIKELFLKSDYSLLYYKKYRSQKIINKMFRIRIKFLNLFFLIPIIIFAVNITYYYIQLNPINWLLCLLIIFSTLILELICINVSFLFIYYIIQPFSCIWENNKLIENTNQLVILGITYAIISGIIFFIPAAITNTSFINKQLATIIIYGLVSLVESIIITKFAEKTFKNKELIKK